jgi:hypothetical protein
MRKIYLCLLFATCYALTASSQQNSPIAYNGIYIVESGSVENNADFKIYTYLRFYKDSSVYLQAVNSLDPVAVNRWFGRYKKFSQRGRYLVKGDSLFINVNNKGTEDIKLEGLQETVYKGTLSAGNKLCLFRDEETSQKCFSYYPVSDTTRQKYSNYKAEIRLPGNWKVKQVLQGSRQVFFINEDSTEVGIAVLPANKLPFYKEDQDAFTSAQAYYKWDSDYMRDEEKMEVKKITENKDKAFVIWNAKDKNNDNTYLFARDKEFLYNIMILDRAMPQDKQLQLLEVIFEMNK